MKTVYPQKITHLCTNPTQQRVTLLVQPTTLWQD